MGYTDGVYLCPPLCVPLFSNIKNNKFINIIIPNINHERKTCNNYVRWWHEAIYGAGVISSLVKKHKLTNPDILICGSGSSGTGSYFMSKQYPLIKDIWLNLGLSKNFIQAKRFWKIIDIKFLLYTIFKKDFPLNEDQIYKSKIKYFIPALNKKNGNIDYFNINKEKNVFENMHACMAIPLAYKFNPKIKINNNNYCDSMASTIAESHIKKAVELGATKIIIISSILHKSNSIDRKIFKTWMFFQKCKKEYYNNESKLLNYKPPKNIKILSIYPEAELTLNSLNNKEETLIKTFNQGVSETDKNKELKQF